MFIKINSSWLIYQLVKALEILPCFFFFLLIIDLYFLIAALITEIFNPTAEIIICTIIITKEAKAEIETNPVIAEAKIRKNVT